MKNKKLQAIIISLVIFGGLAVAGNALAVSYILQGVPCATPGIRSAGSDYEMAPNCGPCDLVRVGSNAANMIMAASGSIALFMFVLAGVMMISSYANPKFVTQAKDILKYTVIGIFLIFGAYTVVNFTIAAMYGGSSDMSVLSGAYAQITGKSTWGVCDTNKLGENGATATK